MFARIATFEGVDVSQAEEAIPLARERAMPIMQGLAGWQGAMQLLDRDNGKYMILHVFDSKENMEAAEPTFETMPQQLGPEIQKMVKGGPSVQKLEVMGARGIPDVGQ